MYQWSSPLCEKLCMFSTYVEPWIDPVKTKTNWSGVFKSTRQMVFGHIFRRGETGLSISGEIQD